MSTSNKLRALEIDELKNAMGWYNWNRVIIGVLAKAKLLHYLREPTHPHNPNPGLTLLAATNHSCGLNSTILANNGHYYPFTDTIGGFLDPKVFP
ncbi:hypothetical protein HK096_000847, partial [Nowakowskiella sp. JEL0078]